MNFMGWSKFENSQVKSHQVLRVEIRNTPKIITEKLCIVTYALLILLNVSHSWLSNAETSKLENNIHNSRDLFFTSSNIKLLVSNREKLLTFQEFHLRNLT